MIEDRDIDADFSPVPFIRDTLIDLSPFRQLSQEFRFTGHDDNVLGFGHSIDFVIGGYWYESTLNANDVFRVEDLGAALSYVTAAQSGARTRMRGCNCSACRSRGWRFRWAGSSIC